VTDKSNTKQQYNLGLYLKLLHRFVRQFKPRNANGQRLIGDEETFTFLLKLIALERRDEGETGVQCYRRLAKDKKRFLRFHHQKTRK